MILRQPIKRVLALSLTLGLGLQLLAAPVLAGDDFAANWQARPLVDNSAKPQAASQASKAENTKPTPPKVDQAALEAKLKPAEPFIASVEKQLLINPKPGALLTDRLESLQTVLYGEQKYQDAGELLTEIAKVFPAEAAKAHADLTAKMQNSLPPATAQGNGKVATPAVQKPTVSAPQTVSSYPQSGFGTSQAAQPQKKKKHFWESDDDPFANDPFFQDQPTPTYQSQQSGPSTLGAIGQGLAGLAMMAGSVAGNYYLNRNSGSGNVLSQNGYYNNPYGNYGYPYGYAAPGYGVLPGQAPYGYGVLPGQAPYGYAQPYYGRPAYGGMTVTTRPYQPYGSTTGAISPLGVPTGLRPY